MDSLQRLIRSAQVQQDSEAAYRYNLQYVFLNDSEYARQRDSLLRAEMNAFRKQYADSLRSSSPLSQSGSKTLFGLGILVLLTGAGLLLFNRKRSRKTEPDAGTIQPEPVMDSEKVRQLKEELDRQLQLDIESFRKRLTWETTWQPGYWNEFMRYFATIYPDFIPSLKEEFPDLTQNELRICALMKLNLTQQDLTRVLNISIESVRKARYRIYKKMGLTSDQELADFMLMR